MLTIPHKVILFLSKRCKVYFFILISLSLIGCEDKVYTINQIKNIKPTHSINNNQIIVLLNNFDKLEKFNEDSDAYVLHVKKDSTKYVLNIAKTEFEIFKSEVVNMQNFKKLKGYFEYKNCIVLLYGDIDSYLFKNENADFKNIMYTNHTEDKSAIIYEPIFIQSEIER